MGDNLNKIVDEYTYATLVDKDLAAQRLERLLKNSLLCFDVFHYYTYLEQSLGWFLQGE